MKTIFSWVIKTLLLQFCLLLVLIGAGNARIIYIGPDKIQKIPSMAAMIATNGDTVDIEAGVYLNDVAVWRAHNLIIRGVNGKVHIKSTGSHAEGKALWVIKGDNTVIENIEFSGASVPDRNGAGIRQEGAGLTLRNCYFHHNENGILSGSNSKSDIIIENSEFAYNGYGEGYTHNIYIGEIRSFTLRFSYIHHAKIGHNVKSRASQNYIFYNRIMDERDGTSSFAIDLPNGGKSYIIGNLIQQGRFTDNSNIITIGLEGLRYPENELHIINNTVVNDRNYATFIKLVSGIDPVKIMNNIFAGAGILVEGKGQLITNLTFPDIHKGMAIFAKKPKLVDIDNFDYRLTKDSPAIDAGTNPGSANGFNLVPEWQYVHPMGSEKRVISEPIDIGAYEMTKKCGK